MARDWTTKERNFVLEHAHRKTLVWIAEQLNRTRRSVSAFMHRNGISYKRVHWTEAEKKFVIDNYVGKGWSRKKVANELGRTDQSVSCFCFRMGIKKNES